MIGMVQLGATSPSYSASICFCCRALLV